MKIRNRRIAKRFVAGLLCAALVLGQADVPSYVLAAGADLVSAKTAATPSDAERPSETEGPEVPETAEWPSETESAEAPETAETPSETESTETPETAERPSETESTETLENAEKPSEAESPAGPASPSDAGKADPSKGDAVWTADGISYAALWQAMEAVTDGGTILLDGEAIVTEWPREQDGKAVTVEGTDETDILVMSGDWALAGETTFRSLSIRQGDGEAYAIDVTDYPLYLDTVEITPETILGEETPALSGPADEIPEQDEETAVLSEAADEIAAEDGETAVLSEAADEILAEDGEAPASSRTVEEILAENSEVTLLSLSAEEIPDEDEAPATLAQPVKILNREGEPDASWLSVTVQNARAAEAVPDEAVSALMEEPAFAQMYEQVFERDLDAAAVSIVYVAGTSPAQSSQVKGSRMNPYTSLADAYANLPGNGGLIVLESDYESDGTAYAGYTPEGDPALQKNGWPDGAKPVMVAAQEPDTALGIARNWIFGGNVGFYHVGLTVTGAEACNIYANGFTAIFGGEGTDNLKVSLASGAQYYPTLFGGPESGTADHTELIVNGGTWDRIFGGGEPETTVSGEARTVLCGRTDGADGDCSITLINKRGSAYKDTTSSVAGGAATHAGSELTGTVGSVVLSVTDLAASKNQIAVNSGTVEGDVSVTAVNVDVPNIRRGDGSIGGDLSITVEDSSVSSLSLKGFNDTDLGFTKDGAMIKVVCTGSTLSTFTSRCFTSSTMMGDRGLDIRQNYLFDNCTVKGELNCQPHFIDKNSSYDFTCTFRDLTFGEKAKFLLSPYADATLINLNLYGTDDSSGSIPAGGGRLLLTPSARAKLTLDNTLLDLTAKKANLTFGDITLANGSILKGNNMWVDRFGGSGKLYLTDQSSLHVSTALAEGMDVEFGVSGELTGLCAVNANVKSETGSEFRYAADCPYTKTIRNNSSTYWYISAQPITYDPSSILYVDQSYTGENREGTASNPYNSLEEAYEHITAERYHVVLMARYEIPLGGNFPEQALPEDVKEVVISAHDGLNDYFDAAVISFEGVAGNRNCNLYSNTVFENIKLQYERKGDKGYANLYVGGNAIKVLDNVKVSNCCLYAGRTPAVAVEKVSMVIHSGAWYSVGIYSSVSTVGDVDTVDQATQTSPEDVVSIEVDGANVSSIQLFGGRVYGNTKLRLANHTGQSRTVINATFHGSLQYEEENINNTYAESFSGSFYGPVTWTSVGKHGGYYGATIAGTYYDGLEIHVSEKANFGPGGGNAFTIGTLKIKNKEANIWIPEGTDFKKIYIPTTSAVTLEQPLNIHLEENLAYMGWISSNPISSPVQEYRNQEIIENLNLIIDGKTRETPKDFELRAFYGFDRVTVMGDALVNAYTDLDVNHLELGENVSINAFGDVTARKTAELAGGSVLSCGSSFTAGGTLSSPETAAVPPTLELKGAAGTENRIDGAVTGRFRLFTNTHYTDVTDCAVLQVQEAYRDQFEAANEKIYIATAADHVPEGKICFGNREDYSKIYVDGDDGSDANDGLSAATAVKTLGRAYELVTEGGAIIISGSYTVDEWPGNAVKKVMLTSYDGTADYRTSNQAVLTLKPEKISLMADTTFGLLTINSGTTRTINLCASGHTMTLGLSPEEMEAIPEGIENLKMMKKNFSLHGNGYVGSKTTDLRIHSGDFSSIYAINGVDNRYPGDSSGQTVYHVTMTGGTASALTTGSSYIYGGAGDTQFTLSGGHVTKIYANYTNDSPRRTEYFDISGGFRCDAFYFGENTNKKNNQKVELRIHDLDPDYTLPKLCLTNEGNNVAIGAPVDVYIRNAHVGGIMGGKNNAADYQYQSGEITLHLQENAVVDTVYAGSIGNYEPIGRMSVRLEDPSAKIGTLYRKGPQDTNGAQYLEVALAFASPNPEVYEVDFLAGSVDLVRVEAGSYVSIPRAAAGNVGGLAVDGGAKVRLANGSEFAGGYSGSGDAANPAVMELANAANVMFGGTVSGTTVLEPVTAFVNGLIIKAAASGETAAAAFVSGTETISYTCDESSSVWTIADQEAGAVRDTVYANGADGVAGAEGSYAAPVRDLTAAYEKAAEIYDQLNAMTDQEIADLTEEERVRRENMLESGVRIVVCEDIRIGSMHALTTDMPRVWISAEANSGAGILFEDSECEYRVPVDTTIDDIVLKNRCSSKAPVIYAQGNTVSVADRVTTDGSGLTICGGGETVVPETNLTVRGGKWQAIYGGSPSAEVGGNVKLTVGGNAAAAKVFGGGEYQTATVTGNVALAIDGGTYTDVYGGGENASVRGTATTDFVSGTVENLYGAGLEATSVTERTVVTIGADEGEPARITGKFRGSGQRGQLSGSVSVTVKNTAVIDSGAEFCAGGYSGTFPTAELSVTGGTIGCNVYAGGWGEGTEGLYGITGSTKLSVTGGYISGNLYGGGKLAPTTGDISVILHMADDDDTAGGHTSLISGSVFGGAEGTASAAANVGGTAEVQILKANFAASQPDDEDFCAIYGGGDVNGTVKKTVVSAVSRPGCRIFGGGRGAATVVEHSEVTLNCDAAAAADETFYQVYGGGNLGKTGTAHVTAAAWTGDVFGGGRGIAEEAGIVTSFKNTLRSVGNFFSRLFTGRRAAAIDGLKDANTRETFVTIEGAVRGHVYGGGELATVGDPDETDLTRTVTHVTICEGAVLDGSVFGGGCGREGAEFAAVCGSTEVIAEGGTAQEDSNVFGGGQNAPVLGSTNVTVKGGELAGVFGGNEMSGAIAHAANVSVPEDSTATVKNIYGGGLLAPYDGDGTNVAIAGGTVENAYGGGYGAAAVVRLASVTVTGGRVDTLYGGGEEATVTEKALISVDVADSAAEAVGTLYCGNNLAEMEIHPTIALTSGHIGTFYGGGNKGAMAVNGGLGYELNSPDLVIDTVYGGCNQADVQEGASLTLTAGSYGTVYGGNNQSGSMPFARVKLAGATVGTTTENADGTRTTTGGIYGGGNRAETERTAVELASGTASDVYGGGNAATVTGSVTISAPANGAAEVTNLFCGNNQADMDIQPAIDLQSGEVWTFYGGGNAGAMTAPSGLTYTFDRPQMHYTYIIGGCNAADVTAEQGITLNLNGVSVDTAVYGGCNEQGNVPKTSVHIAGDVSPVTSASTSVFGGGRGAQTTVGVTEVSAENGTMNGSVYGGSGFGRVTETHVTVRESDAAGSRIVITGNVFGAGYGESSVVSSTDVLINTRLQIHDPNMPEGDRGAADIYVTEELASTSTEDTQSGETSVAVHWQTDKNSVSHIGGNVYGGGNMGQVGQGTIYSGTNTASVSEDGYTHVRLQSGYVAGDLFGGGSGKPADGMNYSLYMGAVFGSCQTDITGGYVSGNVYGGGYQSRMYANPASDRRLPLYFDPEAENGVPAEGTVHTEVLAAQVNIAEAEFDAGTYANPIIVGASVFGGGAKGEGTSTNPTVYTVVGDVEVNIIGRHGAAARTRSTALYFDQTQASGGGIYGDGNLCLVSGEKTVNIRCFNVGYDDAAAGGGAATKVNMLKTFYSLQRADSVNVRHSKFVLRGAEDLVDENADGTLYSVNRVGQLNMYENSTIKLIRIVNYLGGLWSDEHDTTRYINRGNNGMNGYDKRGGVGTDYAYGDTPPAGTADSENGLYSNPDGSIRRMLQNNNRIIHYRNAFMEYLYGPGNYTKEPYNDDDTAKDFADLKSFNEICVANGKYLEIKKSETEYGDVKGVFILSLLHANPGTGGGFVYASIGDAAELNSGSTGAFVCVTRDTSKTDGTGNPLPADQQPYMIISHNVGGYRTQADGNRDYSYYYWYIKGNKYVYDMDVTGYIGTADTDFENSVVLTEMEDRHYILKQITGDGPGDNANASDRFYSGRLLDYWDDTLKDSENYALELRVVSHTGNDEEPKETSIGFLSYDKASGKWGIKKAGGTCVYGKENSTEQDIFKENDLIQVAPGTTNLELMVVLHKGSALLTEIRNVPVTLEFDVYGLWADGGYNTVENASAVQIRLSTSIIRLVPTQDVYLSAGRIYAGVPTDLDIRITGDSAFTVQYITKFMPSAFNTVTAKMTERLTTAGEEIYLLDRATGVGFTLDRDGTLIHVTEGQLADYTVAETDGNYTVTYREGTTHADQGTGTLVRSGNPLTEVKFPAGTMITLLAQIDSYTPTSWYYYCETETSTLDLAEFVKMNSETTKFSFERASGGSVSDTASQRVTENLSFIFDFSQTGLSAEAAVDQLAGQLRLLHTYQVGGQAVDIMDAVSSRTEKEADGSSTVVYTRNYPAVSKTFTVAGGTGDLSLTAEPVADGRAKDSFDVTVVLADGESLGENTRYGEREYAVLLERVDADGKPIPFPAGTTFTYGEELLTPGNGNQAVCIPVKTPGSHTVTVQTVMAGFPPGKVHLKATAYASRDGAYYNELGTGKSAETEFSVTGNPSFALSVVQAENVHLYDAGDTVELTVQTISTIGNDAEPIVVRLFGYDRSGKDYVPVPLTAVLAAAQESCAAGAWNATVAADAASGTYRLEFSYHDKTEYWDFIVK